MQAHPKHRGADSVLHPVGLAAVAIGLLALGFLPFAVFRTSRIHDGAGWSVLETTGPTGLAVLLVLWFMLAGVSLGFPRGRLGSLLRGMIADVLIVAMLLGNAIAASRVAAASGPYSRLSVGAGLWVGLVACLLVVTTCKRELVHSPFTRASVLLGAPVALTAFALTGWFGDTALFREYANYRDRFWIEAASHMAMSAAAVGIATVIGVALGVIAFWCRRLERPVIATVSVLQTVPSLAAIVLMLPLLAGLAGAMPWLRGIGVGGSGWAPVVIVLTAYALLAISVNTRAGLRAVPPAAVDAGAGMGMTEGQLMTRVRLPLAASVVMSGVRTAAVQTIGNATLAAFIGAGGLGVFIFQGMAQVSPDLILLGALTLVLLAVITDSALRAVATLVTPRRPRSGNEGKGT